MTATADRFEPGRSREELRLVEVASGLLLLLDAHRLTGRLPLEVQVQASRLRHAVKLAVQAEAARTATLPPAPPPSAPMEPAGAALRAWIATQPWVQPGPQGWVYLLCFRDLATGQHQPLQGMGCRGQYAGHYWGTTASSGLLTAVGATQGGEVAELSPDRAVSLDETPSSIGSSRLQLDRPVCQGAIDDFFGAQLLPVRRPEDEVAHIPGRARNVALDQVQPCLQVDRAALGTHELTDQVDQLISAQPLRHGAHDGRAGGPSPASGTGPPPGDIRRGEQRPASQHPHLRVHASRKSPAFPDDRAGIVLSCRASSRPAQARPTGHLACDTRREPQPYAATNCRHIQHWTDDLLRRIAQPRNPRWTGAGRLVQVALAAGLTFELAWCEYPATRGRERRLKNQGSAYRRCPLCRGTGGPLDPAAAVAAIQPTLTGSARR
jgi:hypothetical protein